MAATPQLTPYQKAHYNDNRGPAVIAVSSVFIGLSTVAVALRFIARKSRKTYIGIDDWLALGAWVFVVLFCVTCIISVPYGMGKHDWATNPDTAWKIIQIGLFNALVYVIVHWFIKMSILFFYRRVFTMVVPWFRYALYFVGAYVTCWFIGVFFAALFQCTPPDYFWEQYNPTLSPRPKGHCGVKNTALVISSSALNSGSDVMVFLLPLLMLWRLNLKRGTKVALLALFATSALAIAAGLVRLSKTLSAVKPTADVTWVTAEIYMWTAIEASIGLICACLPVIGSLFKIVKEQIISWVSDRSRGSRDHLRNPRSQSVGWTEPGSRKNQASTTTDSKFISLKSLDSHKSSTHSAELATHGAEAY